MQPIRKKGLGDEGKNDYATHSDFCAVFLEHLDRLWLLALLLTGDEVSAEKCFLEAFESCAAERPVFKEVAVGWCRRSVIKTAIRLMSPAPSDPSSPHFPENDINLNRGQDVLLKCVQGLSSFDRFVFVMSVLERYSDRECSVLLGCSFADVLPARIRALQQISRAKKSYPEDGVEAQKYRVDARSA